MSEGKAVFGIDLRDDFTQISYCTGREEGVRTYSFSTDRELFQIPTAALRLPDGVWCFGEDAFDSASDKSLTLINGLLSRAAKGVYNENSQGINYVKLLGAFLSYVTLLPDIPEGMELAEAVITIEDTDSLLPLVVERSLANMRPDIRSVRCISHDESFYYYSLNQSIDLWQRGVLLYNYDNDSFVEKRLNISDNSVPAVVTVSRKDYPEMTPFNIANSSEMDGKFEEIARNSLKERISSVCVTGASFEGGWAHGTYRFMCTKTRVFQGQNLYTKGACYAACDEVFKHYIRKHYIFFDSNKLKVNVGIRALNREGCEKVIWAVDAGNSWYDAKAEKEVLLGSDREVIVVLHSVSSKNERNTVLRLDWIPERPDHCSRVRLEFFFKSVSKLAIRITDLGFGELFRSTGIMKEEIIDLEGT